MTFRSDASRLIVILLVVIVIGILLGYVVSPYAVLLTLPVDDGRS